MRVCLLMRWPPNRCVMPSSIDIVFIYKACVAGDKQGMHSRVWPSGKGVIGWLVSGGRLSVRFPTSALLSLQKCGFIDTVL